jgi:membrane protease YdiL (CAAX protease family)
VLYVVFAIIIILTSKKLRKEKWPDYGFKPVTIKGAVLSVIIGFAFGLFDNYVTEPFINKLTGSLPDLSSYEGVKGSISGLIGMLALGWVVGGVFEETFFRGYLFHRFSSVIKSSFWHKIICIAGISIVFAFAHNYQGIAGIVGTFIFSVVAGSLFFAFQRNVWYLILIHGFYDTVGIYLLYLGN